MRILCLRCLRLWPEERVAERAWLPALRRRPRRHAPLGHDAGRPRWPPGEQAFVLEERLLGRDAAGVAREVAVRADHPVAGDDDRDPVAAVRAPDGSRPRCPAPAPTRRRWRCCRTGSFAGVPTPPSRTACRPRGAGDRTSGGRRRSTRRAARGSASKAGVARGLARACGADARRCRARSDGRPRVST